MQSARSVRMLIVVVNTIIGSLAEQCLSSTTVQSIGTGHWNEMNSTAPATQTMMVMRRTLFAMSTLPSKLLIALMSRQIETLAQPFARMVRMMDA